MPAAATARILLAAAAVAIVAAGAVPRAEASAGGGRPNVVVIETDDQTAASIRAMPTVQRLIGAEGVTFDNSFVSYALCCPSRATFLTGQYAHNHGVLDNFPPLGGYYKLRGENTLPVWLRAAGYRTIHVGKYLNRYGTRRPREIPPGWTDWHGLVDPSTYHYYGFTINDNGRLRTFPPTPDNYQTDVLTRKAVDLIDHAARGSRPFFMWTAFLAPHFSFDNPREPDDPRFMNTPEPAPRDRNRFASTPLPTPSSLGEPDVRDKPLTVREFPPLSERTRAAIRENYQQELETLQDVDRAVGRIVDALRRAGALDRTLIVFTSDNGYFHGEHRIPREKTLPYEPALRVPLLMRGPGVPRGVHLSQLVSNQDLAPTIADVTGAQPGLREDGISLMRLVRHRHDEVGRDLLIEGIYQLVVPIRFDGIRTRRWSFVEYSDGERELYDLVADPGQTRNRDLQPRYARIERALARRVAALRRCAGERCLAHPLLQPALHYGVRFGRAGPCASSAIRVDVRGRDRPRVDRIDVYAQGRRVVAGPLGERTAAVPAGALPGGFVMLRPTAFLADDRAYTMPVRVRVCAHAGYGLPLGVLLRLAAR